MSGYLLWWHRGGGHLPEAALARSARQLAHRGPEGLVRRDLPGVHALHARFTDAVGAEDDLPLVDEHWVVAADLRLDDQRRLRAALRDAGCEPPAGCSDAVLLRAALTAWGPDAATHLVGDFAFAALDRRAGRLCAARGTGGVKGLFVAQVGEAVACSNDLDLLAALPGVDAALDPVSVAEFLQSGAPWSTARTIRRGVARVPMGTQWECGMGTPPRQRRIWEFPEPAQMPVRREEEVVEAFRDVLGEAVADRLRVRGAAILLSGGLDSPSLAATARRVRPSVPLRALTLTSAPVVPDAEDAWAARVAGVLALPHEVMRFADDGAMQHCADRQLATPEPVDESELAAWRAKFSRLAAWGPVTLYGEDADTLLAPPPLLTQLRTRPWTETWRAWRAYRRATGFRPWIGLRESWRGRRPTGLADTVAPSWLRAEASRHLDRAPAARPPAHPTRARAVDTLRAPLWESLHVALDPAVTGRAHSIVLPFLDARVIAFAFALPPIPWCQRKYLLRRAFKGELPDAVLDRPKTPARDYLQALVAQWRARGGAEHAVSAQIEPYVEVPRWREVLRRSSDVESVLAGWRVFELDRWLTQPSTVH